MIRDLKMFSQEEQATILRAIYYHDDRHQRHGAYEEVIKDAIVLQNYFQTSNSQEDSRDSHRLQQVLEELAIPYSYIKTSELAGVLHLYTTAVDKLESHYRYDIQMAYIDLPE